MSRREHQGDPVPTGLLLALFFASGATALIYEVLWLKELGRLFGVTAHAAAATLAVFFLGLSAGGWAWGRRAGRMEHPLRAYGLLEIGIALTALLYFGLLQAYHALYRPLFAAVGNRPEVFLAVKLALAATLLFPPAFLMGGTLPVMAQFLVRRADELGRKVSLLYAVNTTGAALGALAAGFYLPPLLGFRNSYLFAIALNVLIGIVALRFGRSRGQPRQTTPARQVPLKAERHAAEIRVPVVYTVAALSGFATLALEVLWTRMFAQVLQNSVYTFSLLLTVFLVALALGAAVANRLCRRSWSPPGVLFALLVISGTTVALTPVVFHRLTAGLEPIGAGRGFDLYVLTVLGYAAVVLLIPGCVIGSVFPYLMKLAERWGGSAGRSVGQLGAVNTLAAIVGSLAAGFVMLDAVGLWASFRWVALGYLVVALVLPGPSRTARLVPAVLIVLVGTVMSQSALESVRLDPETGEELVELREGSHGTVAIVRRGDDLRLKMDGSYVLGTSLSTPNLRLQSYIPLSIHPDPRSVFYLGMGTGITAGGALDLDVEDVTVCELNPDVAALSRTHLEPYLNGLFEDPRVSVITEDGRNFLYGTDRRYDVVIADIFLTYRAGIGSLYTREHFESVRSRLAPGGIFAQWLTLFDLSRAELEMIAATMTEVFPQVTLWRRGFSSQFPVYALVGHESAEPLDPSVLERNLATLNSSGNVPGRVWFLNIPLASYAGNVTEAESLFADAVILTDDRPLIEYRTPVTEREHRGAGRGGVLAWAELSQFLEDLLRAVPPERDPYLERQPARDRAHVRAGLELSQYEIYRSLERPEIAAAHLAEYRRLLDNGPHAGP